MRVLIVDQGRDRGSLAALRALHSDGWEIGVGSPAGGLAAWSRWCRSWHQTPPAEDGIDAFVAAVAEAVHKRGYEIVMSADDSGVVALSLRRDEIGAVVPYPRHEVLLRMLDKLLLAEAATAAGLATPRTVKADDEGLAALEPPVIVKAALHASLAKGAPGRMMTCVANTMDEAAARADEIRSAGGTPILQELLEGPLIAYSFVADREARVVAAVQQEAIRTWPPGAGVSARARTVPIDPGIADGVARLVRDTRWFGMAELQFVGGSHDRPALIDCNPRPYGSLALAVASGANLPAVCARLATGREIGSPQIGRPGATYQWLPRDIKASIAANGIFRGVLDALAVAPLATHSTWRLDDPAPAIRHYAGKVWSELRGAITQRVTLRRRR